MVVCEIQGLGIDGSGFIGDDFLEKILVGKTEAKRATSIQV
jgi:hypothetical protein